MSGSELSAVKQALVTIGRLRAEVARLSAPEPVAIIGMACRLPGADSPEALWQRLRRGDDAVGEVPAGRWDEAALEALDAEGRHAARQGAFLDDVEGFDAAFFGIAAREAHAMDPQQRLLLELAWEAVERANIDPAALHGSATGVFVGLGTFDYAQAQSAAGVDPGRHYVSGTAMSVAAGRLSYALGLAGPSMVVDTACSSSLVALHQACLSLRARECRVALAGGVGLMFSPLPSVAFVRARMLSPRGRCRTFDASADGYVRGEGGGMVVLKRLSDAEADGDRILAVIRGSAVNQDGASGGLTVPSGPAQEAVMRAALAQAGAAPGDLSYLEAHGTGTPLGDPIELRSVAQVYGGGRAAPLPVGSIKTNFGHLEAAAGIAGVIKAVLCLRHGEVAPHLHFAAPNPHFAWEGSGLTVPGAAMPLPPAGARLAGVNAFGFSGTNAHVVLEVPAAPGAPPPAPPGPMTVLPLSARSPEALRALALRHAGALRGLAAAEWSDWCATAALCRAALPHRLALVAASPGEAAARLDAFAAAGAAAGLWSGTARPGATADGTAPEALAAAFVAGATPDWIRAFGTAPTRRLDLPTMPWQRERFWFGREDGPARPLLRPALRLAASGAAVFAGRPGALAPLVADHLVFGRPVLAGATWLAAALEATQAEGYATLAEIRLPQALATETPEFQVSLEEDGALSVAGRGGGEAWRTCLTARAQRAATQAPPGATLADLRARCTGTMAAAALYDAASRHGISLGPRFRWLAEIRTGAGEALGLCLPPPGVATEEAGRLHPGLLDAGFQLLLAAAGAGYAGTMVPTRIAALTLHGPPGDGPQACHLRLTAQEDGALTADLRFLDGTGRIWLAVTGLEARAVAASALIGGAAQAPDDWFLATEWRDRRLARPALAPIAAAMAPPVPTEAGTRYAAAMAALDQVALAWLARAAATLGWHPGAPPPAQLAPHHRRLFARLEPRLAEVQGVAPEDAAAALHRQYPDIAAEAALVARCGPALPALLRGEAEALPLLFPAGDQVALGRTYAEAFATRAANAALEAALRRWTMAAGPGPLSVLEIGAGTGATTASVLAALPAQGVHYRFTDIGASFLSRAAERFPTVDPGLLDIERDVVAQGFAAGAQDIVVAANVLHATRDIVESLAQARRLLAPGGMLLLVEATAPHAWLDCTFGLTEGWWRFADDRAAARHPLLGVPGWTRRLHAAGFGEVLALPGTEALGQAVILARATPAPEGWLLVEDGCGAAAAGLARSIEAEGGTCRIVPAPLAEIGMAPARIVHLCRGHGDAASHAAHAIATLRTAAQAPAPPPVTLLTFGALAATGADRVDGLGGAGLAGVARVAALELPALQPRLLDADTDEPGQLLAALQEPSEAPVAALRGGALRVPRLVHAAPPQGVPALAPVAWQVISGGLGGIGQALAEALVARGARRVALLARGSPEAAARQRLAHWTAAGAEVRCLACDVADPAAVADAIAALVAEAPLGAVFHAAGTLQDGLLADAAGAAVAPSFSAKVRGAWNLHQATLAHAPSQFVLFSSAAALLGSAGQAAHAAANAWLDGFAAWRRARGLPALSIAWGAWAEIGAAARLGRDEAFRRAGNGTIPPAAGLDALLRLMAAQASGCGVVPLDLPRYLAARPAWGLFAEIAPAEANATAAPQGGTLDAVLADLAQVLGLRRLPDADRPFPELGLDSLATLEFRNRLQARFGRPVPATALFEHGTANRLAAWLDQPGTGAAMPALDDLDGLSEAELDALIGGLQAEGAAP